MTKSVKIYMLLLLSALLTGFTVVMPQIGFLTYFSLIPAALVLLKLSEQTKARRMYLYGFFFFFFYYVVIYHWFAALYPLDFVAELTPASALALVVVAWLGLALLQAIGGGFVFLVWGLACRSAIVKRYNLLKPFLIAAVWCAFEWSQTLFWFGVPWGRLPLSQSKLLVELQTASLFGSYFITFMLVAINFLLAYAVLFSDKRRLCASVAVGIFAFNTLCGSLIFLAGGIGQRETVKVAVIQGNISSQEKWDMSMSTNTKRVYAEHTRAAANEGASIVLWPETAVPYVLDNSSYNEYARALAKETGTTILIGAFTEGDDGDLYNSLIAVHSDGSIGETVYSKRRLVPFGEFVPMRGLLEVVFPPLTELVLSSSDIEAGEGAQIIEVDGIKLGSLICFDSIYEELTLESVREGAELIMLSTNDSWFLDSAAVYMHNSQAQLRAIESGRYIARAANTGVSTVISNRGEVLDSLEPLVDGFIVHEVEINRSRTLYSYCGNIFVYLCILCIVMTPLSEIFLKKNFKNIDKKS